MYNLERELLNNWVDVFILYDYTFNYIFYYSIDMEILNESLLCFLNIQEGIRIVEDVGCYITKIFNLIRDNNRIY